MSIRRATSIPGFSDPEERIRYFHRLGAAVLSSQTHALPG